MSRWLPWLALAACGTAPVEVAPIAGRVEVATPVDAAVVVAEPARIEPRITATSAGEMKIAAPPDGGYAATLDSNGGVRLWPTLDGKHEPVVVRARQAKQIATVRDGDAIAIALVDPIGQVELVRLAGDGQPIDRRVLEVPRPVVELVATGRGFVVRRDDQLLDAIDPDGAVRDIAPAPGTRIERLLVAGDRVLALHESRGKTQRGRWLEADATWGALTPKFPATPDLAVAPDGHELLATLGEDVDRIDLRSGEVTRIDAGAVVGYRDAHTIWYVSSGKLRVARGDDVHDLDPAFVQSWVFTRHGALASSGPVLVIETDEKLAYLGYRSGSIDDLVSATSGGWIAADGERVFHLGDDLQADRELPLPGPEPAPWTRHLVLIDERDVVFEENQLRFHYRFGDASPTQIDSSGFGFQFERSTNLGQIYNSASGHQVLRWNPAKHAFDDELIDLGDQAYGVIRLYDPRANDGLIAVGITDALDDLHPREGMTKLLRRDIYAVGAHARHRDVEIYAPTDTVFSGHSGPMLDDKLPEPVRYAASRDGTLIAELGHGRITLHDRAGNVRWQRNADGAAGLAWNAADELVSFGAGAALLDLETGAYRTRQCGWTFGRWTKPPSAIGAPRMCTADE